MPTVYTRDEPLVSKLSMAPQNHVPFTDETWENHWQRGISPSDRYKDGRENPLHHSWMRQVDLGIELWNRATYLTVDTCRVLVDAACNGMPLRLTWQAPNGSRTTAMVIIGQLFAPTIGHPRSGNLTCRTWGSSCTIPLRHIVEAAAPQTEYSWDHEPINQD